MKRRASTQQGKTYLIFSTQYYDKHGVPPTKRLFKVAMLDPSPKFIGSWGMFGDLGLPIVAQSASSNLSRPEHGFATVLFKGFFSNPRLDTQLVHLFVDDSPVERR
ncbi:hypothetical protein Tco_0386760 [Tanacetum coccineum]